MQCTFDAARAVCLALEAVHGAFFCSGLLCMALSEKNWNYDSLRFLFPIIFGCSFLFLSRCSFPRFLSLPFSKIAKLPAAQSEKLSASVLFFYIHPSSPSSTRLYKTRLDDDIQRFLQGSRTALPCPAITQNRQIAASRAWRSFNRRTLRGPLSFFLLISSDLLILGKHCTPQHVPLPPPDVDSNLLPILNRSSHILCFDLIVAPDPIAIDQSCAHFNGYSQRPLFAYPSTCLFRPTTDLALLSGSDPRFLRDAIISTQPVSRKAAIFFPDQF